MIVMLWVYYVCIDDWRVDGYRWFQYGTKLIPRSEPVLKKLYFMSILPSGYDKRFKRQVFFLLKEKQPQKAVLIHYLGDESIAVNFPHGNSKGDNDQVFHRTCPSVLADQLQSKIFLQTFTRTPFQNHRRIVPLHCNRLICHVNKKSAIQGTPEI